MSDSENSYLRKFEAYAPEIGQAIAMMDSGFIDELKSTSATGSAFDVAEAFSEFWAAWHGGQDSYLYSIGSRFNHEFDFRPGHGLSAERFDSTTREFYACLCQAFNVDDPIRWEYFDKPNYETIK